MAIRNSERVFVQAVAAFADAHGLSLARISHDWLLVLGDGGRRWPILGYDIGLNGSAAVRIANDKAATFDLLAAAGLPAVPHRLVLHPELHVFTGSSGNWSAILDQFDAFGGDVVIKPNEGTSGRDVHRVRDTLALEHAVHAVLSTSRSLAISPYVSLLAEQRFVVLDDAVLLAYEKLTPAVTADGKQSLRSLVAGQLSAESGPSIGEWLATLDAGALDAVPLAGAAIAVGWRHNLGQGARALRLPVDAPGAALACRAAGAIGLRFGSVDIAIPAQGHPQVLEVNSGVMLEHHARQGAAEHAETLALYARALDRLTGRTTI